MPIHQRQNTEGGNPEKGRQSVTSRPRARSVTAEISALTARDPAASARLNDRMSQVEIEVGESVRPLERALARLRDAIALAQSTNGQTPAQTEQPMQMTRTRATTRIVDIGQTNTREVTSSTYGTREAKEQSTPDFFFFSVIDNSQSMSSELRGNGLLNMGDESTFAKVEERTIVLYGQALKAFSARATEAPFSTQTIMFGLPYAISLPGGNYNVVDRSTGSFEIKDAVVAKAVTPFDTYTDEDEAGIVTLQGSSNSRSGPTILAPALNLVVRQLKEFGLKAEDFVSGKKVAVVMVSSDFFIHDGNDARAVVEKLQQMGVRVIAQGIEGDVHSNAAQQNMESVVGEGHGTFSHSPQEIVAFVNAQADLEDKKSGVNTSILATPVGRRTRATTSINGTSRNSAQTVMRTGGK